MAQSDWLEKDYYKTLGVSSTASKDEIKKAYRKLAQKYHPDANSDDKDAETRFKEVSEAHSILSNDEKRKEYDQMRQFVDAGGERIYGFGPNRGGGNVRVNIGDLFGDGADAGNCDGGRARTVGLEQNRGEQARDDEDAVTQIEVHATRLGRTVSAMSRGLRAGRAPISALV